MISRLDLALTCSCCLIFTVSFHLGTNRMLLSTLISVLHVCYILRWFALGLEFVGLLLYEQIYNTFCRILDTSCSILKQGLWCGQLDVFYWCRLKCYISCDGDSALLGDTTQVLDALLASYGSSLVPHQHSKKNHHYGTNNHYRSNNIHPLVKVTSHHGKNTHSLRGSGPPPSLRFLYEACREQRNKCGCGVTSLVCLTAYWAPEILSLLRQVSPV